ncbi:hypothetical protein TREMEDRAFT_58611 [Tremella mesenterica DSM 1558]|uniref:uncharacterized protein n=1 Tax=Tremella mesenterica (strain ATCC 24925 / CBS 8224 / DSM 1558 / NBRC 9311 / NRRL Y-6157 / RJB 2259-6 / UBC 559-6) TaxID=578456 RepID=UPI0003F48F41|nr:uncharacterized protein TREMEDRAFT_58611 [Tremella mesenterica DSM 1558]EIW72447.1 hypothetical protein TREMEDRAFT_58611 [Tremella mesenterica DSM 1558]
MVGGWRVAGVGRLRTGGNGPAKGVAVGLDPGERRGVGREGPATAGDGGRVRRSISSSAGRGRDEPTVGGEGREEAEFAEGTGEGKPSSLAVGRRRRMEGDGVAGVD